MWRTAARAGRAALFGAAMALTPPAFAGSEIDALIDALQIGETTRIMHAEGVLHGEELAAEMLPDADALTWAATVARIYDADKMYDLVVKELTSALAGTDPAPLTVFFASDLGQEIVALELSAREAFIDTETEAAARALYEEQKDAGAVLVDQIEAMIADSDLVEHNVMGALNSNLMFYRGLVDGGAYDMSEEDMLSDVWSQEADVRDDSHDWLHAYLMTAYQPLEKDELDAYLELWRSDDGKALNQALFTAFDRMYDEISYLLGQAVAQHMQNQKL